MTREVYDEIKEILIAYLGDCNCYDEDERVLEAASTALADYVAEELSHKLIDNQKAYPTANYTEDTDLSELLPSVDELVSATIIKLRNDCPEVFGKVLIKHADVAKRPVKIQTNTNPWKKDTFSLEEQTRLYRQDMSLAREMAAAAGYRI
ncbi:MAG: hypothetical protein FWC95_05030 [Defluviitaleaceae bacterium]|nr:hypothetical protein [Defluviitaleaceae bacterium]